MKLYPANVLLSLLSLCATQLAGSLAQRTPHRFKLLSSQRVRSIMRCHDVESLFQNDLPAIAKPRVPGTPGHQEVQEYIVSRLQQLDCSRWNITEHSFEDRTPHGVKSFTNIVATLDPEVDQRLVLAAHWDSKVLPPKNGKHFVGATDSALPVALLLDLALQLDQKLQERERTDYSLQLIFFDGEEAFVRWTATDSLYGSRQLAADMSEEGGLLSVGEKTGIQAMEALILLDLIGSTKPNPSFYDMYSETTNLFQRLVGIEKRLKRAGHLEAHSMNYFKEPAAHYRYQIGDDHQPFLEKGVPVVHLITSPFPRVWHTLDDDLSAIDMNMVSNFKKIMMVFLHEYFHFG